MQNNMLALFNAAKDNMTTDDLAALASDFSDIANDTARDMSSVVEGIYCLVSTEEDICKAEDKHGFIASGQFSEPGSVMSLLGCISRQFDLIAGLIEVSNEAQSLEKWKETGAAS